MNRMLTGLTLVFAAACATETPSTGALSAEPSRVSSALASMHITGSPELEAARLENWQGSITLLEGAAGGPDTLEVALVAVDEAQDVSGGLAFAREVTHATGLRIDGDHTLNEMGALGQPNQFNVRIKGQDYTATSGKVHLSYVAGKLVGKLDARIEPIGGAGSESRAMTVSAALQGPMSVSCQVLRDALPSPDAQGGEIEDPLAEPGLVWVDGRLDQDFCRRYL